MVKLLLLIRRCNHKNIVKYIGCFSDRECLYLMTEYLGIGSLEHCLHKTRTDLSIELSLSIAFDVAQGMMYLHELNPQIIHRDLSPSNVLVCCLHYVKRVENILHTYTHAHLGSDNQYFQSI